jgi:hypothetical protein
VGLLGTVCATMGPYPPQMAAADWSHSLTSHPCTLKQITCCTRWRQVPPHTSRQALTCTRQSKHPGLAHRRATTEGPGQDSPRPPG